MKRPFAADRERGEKPPAQRKKWREPNKNIAVSKQQLTSGDWKLDEFWIFLEALVQITFE